MITANHKVDFDIPDALSLFYHTRAVVYTRSSFDSSSFVLYVSPFLSSVPMPEVLVEPEIGNVDPFLAFFTSQIH